MPELTREQQRERVRKRVRAATNPENYTYFPEKENTDYVKSDEFQRVAIYARVSTADPAQTSSFELQQKYYMDMVSRNPKWILVDGNREDIILAHTCPYNHRPVECFIGGVDERSVDTSMERFLQEIVDMADYNRFYCGHWHIDKQDAKIRFLFNDIVMLEEEHK